MDASKGTVARKPRRAGWSKVVRKYGIQLGGLVIPTLRYCQYFIHFLC